MAKRITAQQVNPALQDSDIILTAKSSEDYQLTIEALSTHIINKIASIDTFNQVLDHDDNVSGLNANFLQGLDAAFLRNALNLNAGTVPDARLPQGEFNTSWTASGIYPTEGILKGVFKLPDFIPGGPRIMLQTGWTKFLYENQSVNITFLEPFTSGFATADKPNVILSPECRSEFYPSQPASSAERVEIDVRLYEKHLGGFSCGTTRTSGSGADVARANWFAWGYY